MFRFGRLFKHVLSCVSQRAWKNDFFLGYQMIVASTLAKNVKFTGLSKPAFKVRSIDVERSKASIDVGPSGRCCALVLVDLPFPH